MMFTVMPFSISAHLETHRGLVAHFKVCVCVCVRRAFSVTQDTVQPLCKQPQERHGSGTIKIELFPRESA